MIKVDCIVRKSSAYRRVEFDRKKRVPILDFTTYIVSKEDLTISKLFWAKDSRSEIQLGDVKDLLGTGVERNIYSAGRVSSVSIICSRSIGMTDTGPEIERMVRERVLARSGEERFVMGAEMFEAARTMVMASLPAGLSPAERKRKLFKRIYGGDLRHSAAS